VSAHEVLHEVHSKKLPILVLKLDYEKAYDRIDWNFLDYMLETRNFGPNFRRYVKAILHHGYLYVRINGINRNYFVARKGLKQGDPISPILYNIIWLLMCFQKFSLKLLVEILYKGFYLM
jgi:retron-type reverse transcriptase